MEKVLRTGLTKQNRDLRLPSDPDLVNDPKRTRFKQRSVYKLRRLCAGCKATKEGGKTTTRTPLHISSSSYLRLRMSKIFTHPSRPEVRRYRGNVREPGEKTDIFERVSRKAPPCVTRMLVLQERAKIGIRKDVVEVE